MGSALKGGALSPPPAAKRPPANGVTERLQQQAETSGCQLVLTGHTASDRAETLLFHLIRGADLTGLSSLRQTRPGRRHHAGEALLAFSRADTSLLRRTGASGVATAPTATASSAQSPAAGCDA